MKTTLKWRDGILFIVEQQDGAFAWLPIRQADEAEARAIDGLPVTKIDAEQGVYSDEEGNTYQLADVSNTKPIAVEHVPAEEKSDLEQLLEASLGSDKKDDPDGAKPRSQRNSRGNTRKTTPALRMLNSTRSKGAQSPDAEANHASVNGEVAGGAGRLNLLQKLAEVRRRIGYVQKRGHNERFNYSYVTAADIAGSIGDLLSELGVIVVPSLESVTYESSSNRGETTRTAQVVMAYTFADVESGDSIMTKVAGQGLDPGDKAPYKAMTGALKYALLQSFLLATGDDPEEERAAGRSTARNERRVTAEEIRTLKALVDETGTEPERVLTYYKLTALEEMTEPTYRRALEVLNRKRVQPGNRETVHAQD